MPYTEGRGRASSQGAGLGVLSTACRGLRRGKASQTFCFKDEVPVGKMTHVQNFPELSTLILEPSSPLEGCTTRPCRKPRGWSRIVWKGLRRKLVAPVRRLCPVFLPGQRELCRSLPWASLLPLLLVTLQSVQDHLGGSRKTIVLWVSQMFFVSLGDFFLIPFSTGE